MQTYRLAEAETLTSDNVTIYLSRRSPWLAVALAEVA
jgi:hypothetical protein